jgi:hypothetical protein
MEVVMTLEPPAGGPRRTLARLIEDYNPFYLLSAACMLFGIFALNNSLTWSPLPLRRLLTMIVTLNLYELILIGLAVFLMRRGIRRDALLLLIVEAFFLADVGFLNMEVFTTSAKIGLLVNAFVLVAAVVKVALVFNAAKIPLADARFVFVVTQLGVLFAVPGIFAVIAQHRNDFLPSLAVYAAWWLVGALPVVYAMTVGSIDLFRKHSFAHRFTAPTGMDVIVSRVLVTLPMLSLIAHLCLANWIYKVEFHPANLAPLLLGLAVLAGHADEHPWTLGRRMQLQLGLPLLAVALSAYHMPRDLMFPLTHAIDGSPLRLSLIVASFIYLEGLWHFHAVPFAIASAVSLACSAMGHTVGNINDSSIRMAKSGATLFDKFVPKTLPEWGVLSVVASFLLLAIGTMITLKRRTPVANMVINLEENDMTG